MICMAGTSTQAISTGSGCPSASVRAANVTVVNNDLDSSRSCTITANICNTGSCASSEPTSATTTISKLTITLNDGPVQLAYSESSSSTINYLPTHQVFNVDSYVRIAEFSSLLQANSEDNRMFRMGLSGVNYNQTWVYSSKKQYIEARPWLLSSISLSILKPTTLSYLLIPV